MFIRLTREDKSSIRVNSEKITMMVPDEKGGTMVHFESGMVIVIEPIREILSSWRLNSED